MELEKIKAAEEQLQLAKEKLIEAGYDTALVTNYFAKFEKDLQARMTASEAPEEELDDDELEAIAATRAAEQAVIDEQCAKAAEEQLKGLVTEKTATVAAEPDAEADALAALAAKRQLAELYPAEELKERGIDLEFDAEQAPEPIPDEGDEDPNSDAGDQDANPNAGDEDPNANAGDEGATSNAGDEDPNANAGDQVADEGQFPTHDKEVVAGKKKK